MRFRILGPVEVDSGGTWIGVPAAKQRTLLAALVLNAGSVVSQDQICAELWGDDPPRTVVNQVHGYVMRLRRLLGDPDGRLLVRRAPGYLLAAARDDVDAGRFESALAQGRAALRAGDPGTAADLLADGLALWRGAALVDTRGTPLADAAAVRLDEQRVAAVEARIDADLACGRHAAVVDEVRALLDEQPLREHLWGQLMLALYRCGRQADALSAYQEVHRLLDEELGVAPNTALQRLHVRILNGDGDLHLSPSAAAGGPASLPAPPVAPVAPSAPTPRQLPVYAAGFVGRDCDMKLLDALLADREHDGGLPIGLLTGTAGVGKTTLAVHWAHSVAGQFPDGQLFLDLRGHAEGQPVPPAAALARFLRALGVPAERVPVDTEEAAERFRSLVAGRRLLIVLDNAASADQVRPLLPGSPSCVVVVTSRERLGGLVAREGARPLAVERLSQPDAVDLLARTLGAHRVSAEPDAAAELARLCAYLPLALRVAAANLASRPRQPIATHADALAEGDRLAVLTADGDEQTAVRAAFDLSYRRLPDPARRAFRLLGVAPGDDHSLAAVAALAGRAAGPTRRILDRLCAAHLVEEVAAGRFGCHDLLHEFALQQARREDPAADRQAAVRRLLRWYVDGADAAAEALYQRVLRVPAAAPGPPGMTGSAARAWLDAEHTNLVAAVVYAATTGEDSTAWRLTDALRGHFRMTAQTYDWLTVAEAGAAAADRAGDPHALVATRLSLADAHRTVGRYAQALEHYGAALATASRLGWREAQATILGNAGTVHRYQGRLRQAAEHYRQAIEVHRAAGRHVGVANTLTSLGCVHLEMGRPAEATDDFAEALALHRRLGSRDGEAIDLCNLGDAYHARGALDEAIDHYTRGLLLHREVGDRQGEVYVLLGLAAVHRDAGRAARALSLARSGLALADEVGDARLVAAARNAVGAVLIRLGRPAEALVEHRAALALARSAGAVQGEMEALLGLAAAGETTDPDRAEHDARQALNLATAHGYPVLESQALTTLAHLCLTRGAVEESVESGQRALTLRRACSDPLGSARTLVVLGRALPAAGRREEARALLHEALATFDGAGVPESEEVRAMLQAG